MWLQKPAPSRPEVEDLALSTTTARCCGFTEECTKPIIKRRARKIRGCIYSYGLATGGEQFFYHRG